MSLNHRNLKLQELYAHQKKKLDHYNAEYHMYIPKNFFVPAGEIKEHIGFFQSEIEKGAVTGLYTERVDRNLESEDPKRRLYFIKPEEFKKDLKIYVTRSGIKMNLIPVSKAEVVTINSYEEDLDNLNEEQKLCEETRLEIVEKILKQIQKITEQIDELIKIIK